MSSLIVGGVSIPVAPGGIDRAWIDLVDRARALDGTYRASATGTAKRDWNFSTPPITREFADFFETILQAVAAQVCSGDVLGGSQNRLLRSEDMSNAVWNNTNVTVTNSVLAPNGTATAFKLLVTGAGATTFNQSASVSATAATFSTFVKQGSGPTEGNKFGLRNSTTATDLVFITFDYATGAVTYTVGASGVVVEPLWDGWYRLKISATSGITSGNTLIAYNGYTGGAETASKFLYTWGAQLDAAAEATSYVKTTTAVVDTRSVSCFSEITGWQPVKKSSGHLVVLSFALHEA